MDALNKLGTLVNEVRKREGLTLREISKRTGISHVYVSHIESGLHLPAFKKSIQLSMALPFTAEERETYVDYLQEIHGENIDYDKEVEKIENELPPISNGRLNDFGALIKEKRKKEGMTLQLLAKQLNVSQGYISRLERNKAFPTLQRTLLLTHALPFTEEERELVLAYVRKQEGTTETIEDFFDLSLLASDLSDLSKEDIEDIKQYIQQTKEKRKKNKKAVNNY